jgi:hypothetical protein
MIRLPAQTRSQQARAAISVTSYVGFWLAMKKPKIDEKLTLLADFGETEAICAEVLDNPATEEGILLKVMTRGPFEQGQQVWIVDRHGSKIGATVESVSQQTIDSEVTLSTVLPA